jgi:hypothetical protein
MMHFALLAASFKAILLHLEWAIMPKLSRAGAVSTNALLAITPCRTYNTFLMLRHTVEGFLATGILCGYTVVSPV